MRPSVLVTRASFPDIVEKLNEHFDVTDNPSDTLWTQPELIAHLQGKRGAVTAGSDRIDATLLDACPELKAVCNIGVGYNNVDVDACTARGVLVTNTPDVLTQTTADFGFAFMMAAARRITESEHFLRAGEWIKTGRFDMFVGGDVYGATLGILGMGRIGQEIAKRASRGFGMDVIYHNRTPLTAAKEAECGARYVEKEALLRESDHLILVVPYSASSHHAIGRSELKQMKSSATLTNIARGGVVDDLALAEALSEGSIAAAALDVFEGEPQVNPALLTCKNVVLTPHIGSASIRTRRAMASLCVDNLIAALNGGQVLTPVNPQVLTQVSLPV